MVIYTLDLGYWLCEHGLATACGDKLLSIDIVLVFDGNWNRLEIEVLDHNRVPWTVLFVAEVVGHLDEMKLDVGCVVGGRGESLRLEHD